MTQPPTLPDWFNLSGYTDSDEGFCARFSIGTVAIMPLDKAATVFLVVTSFTDPSMHYQVGGASQLDGFLVDNWCGHPLKATNRNHQTVREWGFPLFADLCQHDRLES